MAHTNWRIRGPEFTTCNCAWGCPCQFNALPTHGHCKGFMAVRVDKGHFGDVRLDGLCWAGMVSWPGAIHEGNGTLQWIIDERADGKQREALVSILTGQEAAPGTFFQIFNAVVSTTHEPLFKPIEFDIDINRRTARAVISGLLEARGEPIRNPVTEEEHEARLILPQGFEYTEAEFGSGTVKSGGQIALDTNGTHAHFAMVHWTHDGVDRSTRLA